MEPHKDGLSAYVAMLVARRGPVCAIGMTVEGMQGRMVYVIGSVSRDMSRDL